MNKILILVEVFFLSSLYSTKYESSYYKNTSNILEKYPKIDIDYIFSKSDTEENNKNEQSSNSKEDSTNNNKINNPSSNILLNTFYDYYQTSVPLYDEKMKCYFPIKKNLSLNINNANDKNTPKIKNISQLYGKTYIRSLKGKCEKYYIERWYYTLCPLLGAIQTLSYIKPDDNKKEEEKQEVNYLGYEINEQYNDTYFLKELKGEYKNYVEKKYHNEIMDIIEENLFNIHGKKNKIFGVYKNIIKFYGENVLDSTSYTNYTKKFIVQFSRIKGIEKQTFETNIIKVINNNMILLNQTFSKFDLKSIDYIHAIKILKNPQSYVFPNNLNEFLNQSFFIYDDYLYASRINLALCVNMNCHATISNDINVYKLDIIVDTKLAILEKGIDRKREYKNENYCLFYGDDLLYYFGRGEVEELTETAEPSTFILYGENLDIEDTEKIILFFNDTIIDYTNYFFVNDIFNSFNYEYITLQYQQRINSTHYKVKMVNKKDLVYFEKQITLDGKYVIARNNKRKKKEKEIKKEDAKYIILGNDKNLSLDDTTKDKKETLKIENSKEEYKAYKIANNKEFVFNFELLPYNNNLKDSYITICFSSTKKCKIGEDYEILIDLNNDGVLMQKMNETNNDSLVYSIIKFKISENDKVKSGIIYMNSTIYFNFVFKEEKAYDESEIKLKYNINNESYAINYIIINQNKSKNIYIDNINIDEYVSFNLFKNIFFYEQKFLLEDNAIYIDTFENGDYCSPKKAPRRVIIYYSCDEEGIYDLKLDKVFEDKNEICVYHYYAKSRYLCNPNTLMRNYLKFSGLKTYCYLDN